MRLPRSMLCLALAGWGLAAFNLLGVFDGVARYALLSQEPLSVPPAYLIAGHALWAAGWAAIAVGVWRRKAWARWGMLASAVLYVAHGWLNRWVWSRSDYVMVTELWALALGMLGVVLTGWLILSDKHWLVGSEKR
jgi:hypothetical protein